MTPLVKWVLMEHLDLLMQAGLLWLPLWDLVVLLVILWLARGLLRVLMALSMWGEVETSDWTIGGVVCFLCV